MEEEEGGETRDHLSYETHPGTKREAPAPSSGLGVLRVSSSSLGSGPGLCEQTNLQPSGQMVALQGWFMLNKTLDTHGK